MRKLRVLAAATATAVTLGLVGMTSPASADIGDDVPIILDNAPAAVDALVDGLQATIGVITTTQSAVGTSQALGDTVVAVGSALVAGTEQLGALSLAFALTNGSIQQTLAPYLGAIDDPSTAGDLFDPEDVNTILGNLGPAVDYLLHGFADNGVAQGVAEVLRGNVYNGLAGGGLYFLMEGTFGSLAQLTGGTSYQDAFVPLAVVALVVLIGGGEYLQQLQDAIGPLFETLNPLTEPVAAVFDSI